MLNRVSGSTELRTGITEKNLFLCRSRLETKKSALEWPTIYIFSDL
jgi:hypothetical protein